MKISEAKTAIASILKYNLEQYEANRATGRTNNNVYVTGYLVSDPGLGKTSAVKQVAEEYELPYSQSIIAQMDAGEMAGLPFRSQVAVGYDEANKTPVYEDRMVRLRPSYLPSDEFGIFNLDELPQAFLANQNIASQLVNEYRVGEHEISPGITIVGTGNKPENKAGTTTMPTHLRDRLTFIPIEADLDDFLAYAAEVGFDPRIRAYLRNNPVSLHKFDPTATASPTPRSWHKTSAILSMGLHKHIRTQLLSGQLGDGEAVQFERWLRVEDKMPKLEDILKHPEQAPVFSNKEADVLYLLLANLADIAKNDNIEAILKYITRLPNQEFAAYWAADAFKRDRELLSNKHVTKWKLSHGTKLIY